MKRHLWESSLSSTACPPWPCTACNKGVLRLKKDTLTHEETTQSKRWSGSDDWIPEHVEFTFIAWAQCNNEKCNEAYAISGLGGIEQEYTGDDEGTTDWVSHFYPTSIVPTLAMIDLPSKFPNDVKRLLNEAYACYWSQPDASASRIRAALEVLLTHVGVPTDEKKSDDKSVPISLHKRIELYSKENSVVGQQLMAIKWLGNTGSHGSRVSKADILDALELLEHALIEMLDKKSEKMIALAKRLAAKHGPSAA